MQFVFIVSYQQMLGRQAKILSDEQIATLILYSSATRNPERNRVLVLLSVKAGLRAGEIANLAWDMVLDGGGAVGAVIELRDHAAKKKSGRRIPIHPDLHKALIIWQAKASTSVGPVVTSERGSRMTAVSIVIVNWFAGAFRAAGLKGCSSHSGRRTFITRAARSAHQAGASMRDIQLLAGHRSIQTTQRYIDGDTDAQRKLVSLI
jgi:integrase/recombinase XerD